MNDVERNRLATLTRVRDFGGQHPTIFPAGKLTGELMTTIGAVVDELTLHATTQEASAGAARQSSVSKSTARTELRDDVEAVNRAAHAMAFDMPGLDDKFRLPRGGDQNLLATARAYLTDATPLKDNFIRFGLPDNFLDDLSADIHAFEQAIAARNHSVEERAASVAAIDEKLASGMKALKQLDLILRNVLRNDITKLTAWMTASHVERVAHRRRPVDPATPEPPAK